MGHVSATFTQAGYRWRNDDGNESGATYAEALNTAITLETATVARCRIILDETAGGAENNVSTQWQYQLNGGGWNNVTTSSSVVQAATSTQGSLDATATTQQISAGTFVSAEITEDGLSDAVRPSFAGNELTELELVCQLVDADVSDEDTVELRVIRANGTPFSTYSQTPSLTVSKVAGASEGSASGSVTWVGAADGTATHEGSGAGAITWLGSATGEAPTVGGAEGSASGAISWAGTAGGEATHEGAGSGEITWSGSAEGEAPTVGAVEGSASGSIAWSGAADGKATHEGSSTGSIDWTGSATGEAPVEGQNSGSASGAVAWVGAATSEAIHEGSSSGSISWAGSADGESPTVGGAEGTASGSVAWAGSADGVTTRSGSASGSISWAGTATGGGTRRYVRPVPFKRGRAPYTPNPVPYS